MAGDNQMDPATSQTLVEPVARGEVDYAKANRLFTGQAWDLIPRTRYLGNAVLSPADEGRVRLLARRRLADGLHRDLARVPPAARPRPHLRRYGLPNDMLVHLNIWNARVRDFPSRPIYNVGERSGIRLRKVVPRISWLLVKGFFLRMREKYVIRDFHPLVFFYFLGFLMTTLGLVLGIVEVVLRLCGNAITTATIVLVALLLISGSPVHALRDVVRHGVEQGSRRARSPPDRPRVAMLLFILALLTLCVAAATAAAALRLRSFVSFLLAAYLFASAGIVLCTEVLSPFRRADRWGYLVAELILLCAAGIFWNKRGRPHAPPAPRVSRAALLRHPAVAGLALVVGAAVFYEAFVILASPPNNGDSMSGGLVQAAEWFQHRGVFWIPDAYSPRQNEWLPIAQMEILYTLAFLKRDLLAAVPQFVAQAAIVVAVYGTAQRGSASLARLRRLQLSSPRRSRRSRCSR